MTTLAPLRAAHTISALGRDCHAGLSLPQKTIPCRWLYDARGSRLFEIITTLPEYYPTRAEFSVLQQHAASIAAFVGPEATLYEYGAGAAHKSEVLLAALQRPYAYVAIDIDGECLQATADRLGRRFPGLWIETLAVDFTTPFAPLGPASTPASALFMGSTLGNLDRTESLALLDQMRRMVEPRGTALVGIDLIKDLDRLLPAYDDAEGVTATFNLNLLRRLNRELGANFRVERFRHEARWNAAETAVEMHLVSTADQSVKIEGRTYIFRGGETIHTESSRKYDLPSFSRLVEEAGWRLAETWTDLERRFAVCGLRTAS